MRLLLVFLCLAGDAWAADKVVVLPVRGVGITDAEAFGVVAQLRGSKAVTLAEAQELHASLAGCTATTCLVEKGADAGLRWVAAVHIGRVGGRVVLVVKRVRIPDLVVEREMAVVSATSPLREPLVHLMQSLWAREARAQTGPLVAALFRAHEEGTDPILAELWTVALARAGNHRVVGQGDVESLLELKTCLPPKCTPVAASAFDVDRIAMLSLGTLGHNAVLMAKLIDVKQLEVVTRETAIVSMESVVDDVERVARALLLDQ